MTRIRVNRRDHPLGGDTLTNAGGRPVTVIDDVDVLAATTLNNSTRSTSSGSSNREHVSVIIGRVVNNSATSSARAAADDHEICGLPAS